MEFKEVVSVGRTCERLLLVCNTSRRDVVKAPQGADTERTSTTHDSPVHSKMEERDREREPWYVRARAGCQGEEKGVEGGGEWGQTVKHVSFCLLMLTRT